MFKNMPLILVMLIVSVIVLGPLIPLSVKSGLFAVSLVIKSGIIFLLPIIVFCLLFKAVLQLTHKATGVLVVMLGAICISNFIATFLSRFVGLFVYQQELSVVLPNVADGLQPTFHYSFPRLLANDKAMLLGLTLGIVVSWLKLPSTTIILQKLEVIISRILSLLTGLVPLFITGFIVKLHHDGLMAVIVRDYAVIFVVIACALFCYITLMYLIANGFHIRKTLISMSNMLPAGLTAFGSMSSATALPLTIVGTEKNCKNKGLAHVIIPASVNFHLIGDCISIPVYAFAVLKSFGFVAPSLINYVWFAVFFVIAKFSVAAVPGGGILVMLPILEKYLGFNGEMLSLITALYVLFDPVTTSANVFGNGAFAMLLDRFLEKKS